MLSTGNLSFNMMLVVVVSCLLAVVTASPATSYEPEWEQPDFCSVECPAFHTIETREGYEIRKYQATRWVSTAYSANTTEARDEHKRAFWRLFRYIGGENSAGVKIPMTVPVVTEISPCSTQGCEASFVRSFYIPSAFQEETPVPTNELVYIDERPPVTLFVKSFTGWKNQAGHEASIAQLTDTVGDRAKPDFYYKAGFGPYRSPTAHNEVWLEVA